MCVARLLLVKVMTPPERKRILFRGLNPAVAASTNTVPVAGASVGEAVGVTVGEALGVMVGEALGVMVGEALGLMVGEALGLMVGEALGLIVDEALGLMLGVALPSGKGSIGILRVGRGEGVKFEGFGHPQTVAAVENTNNPVQKRFSACTRIPLLRAS
jgi:hypothetical protein